jgi:hypothetical protein
MANAHVTNQFAASQLAAIFHKGSSKYFLSAALSQSSRIPLIVQRGALSGSAKAILNQYANITATGTVRGQSLGVISGGQLNGQLEFEEVSPNVYTADAVQVNIFGNSALNVGGPKPGLFTIPDASANFFQFSRTRSTVAAWGLLPYKIPSGSGATRALLNQYKYLARTSVGTSANLVSHPVGGELYGTSYDNVTNVLPDSIFVAAFGKNPLNIPTLPNNALVTITNPSNYLLLANGKRLTLSGGQLLSTEFDPQPNGKFAITEPYSLFAFGSSPFNTGVHGPRVTIDPKTFVNYLLH